MERGAWSVEAGKGCLVAVRQFKAGWLSAVAVQRVANTSSPWATLFQRCGFEHERGERFAGAADGEALGQRASVDRAEAFDPHFALVHVLGQGGRLALAGVILGAIGAAVVGRVLASLLYGVSPFDPPAYAFAAGLLFVVATLANLAPALTAAHIDPLKALRRD